MYFYDLFNFNFNTNFGSGFIFNRNIRPLDVDEAMFWLVNSISANSISKARLSTHDNISVFVYKDGNTGDIGGNDNSDSGSTVKVEAENTELFERVLGVVKLSSMLFRFLVSSIGSKSKCIFMKLY